MTDVHFQFSNGNYFLELIALASSPDSLIQVDLLKMGWLWLQWWRFNKTYVLAFVGSGPSNFLVL